MSENRENSAPGDPVDEEPSTQTEVLAAARRATGGDAVDVPDPASDAAETTALPEAEETSGDLIEEIKRKEEAALVDTQLDLTPVSGEKGERVEIAEVAEMPSAAADPTRERRPARDGEMPLDSVEQLAALYSQTPLPPEVKGNRGAGVLISLLAALAFAIVYAGGISLVIMFDYPASTFLTEGLVPRLMTVSFGAAVLAFFVAQMILVLILGRASWWWYALGGFFVAVAVWVAAFVGAGLHARFILGQGVRMHPLELFELYALLPVALIAAVVAREVSLWFGVWIGVRGRKVKQRNTQALDEYEASVAAAKAV